MSAFRLMFSLLISMWFYNFSSLQLVSALFINTKRLPPLSVVGTIFRIWLYSLKCRNLRPIEGQPWQAGWIPPKLSLVRPPQAFRGINFPLETFPGATSRLANLQRVLIPGTDLKDETHPKRWWRGCRTGEPLEGTASPPPERTAAMDGDGQEKSKSLRHREFCSCWVQKQKCTCI